MNELSQETERQRHVGIRKRKLEREIHKYERAEIESSCESEIETE